MTEINKKTRSLQEERSSRALEHVASAHTPASTNPYHQEHFHPPHRRPESRDWRRTTCRGSSRKEAAALRVPHRPCVGGPASRGRSISAIGGSFLLGETLGSFPPAHSKMFSTFSACQASRLAAPFSGAVILPSSPLSCPLQASSCESPHMCELDQG